MSLELKQLPIILEQYKTEYEDCIEQQQIAGKPIGDVCRTNHVWGCYYEERSIELRHILAQIEVKINAEKASLYKTIKKSSNIALSEREIMRYIDAEDSYITLVTAYNEVDELYKKFNAATEGFKHIGYSINNLTKLMVAQIDDMVL